MKSCIFIDMVRTLWNGTRQPDEETCIDEEAALLRITEIRKEWEFRVYKVEYKNFIIKSIVELDEGMKAIGSVEKIHVPLNYSTEYALLKAGSPFPEEIRKGHHSAGNIMMECFGISQLPADDDSF